MAEYTTQMGAARKGIITPQMEIVAEKEHMAPEQLRELIAKGEVIIPCNKNHKALSPSGVGAKLTTKINVNLGVSRDWKDVDMIRVKDADVRHQLGIEGNMACFADFFDSKGHYLLKEGKHLDIEDKLTTVVLLTKGQLYTPLSSDSHRLSPAKIEAEIIYNTVPWQPILFSACFFLAILSFALKGRRAECRFRGIFVAAQALLTTVLLLSLLLRWYVSGHCPLTSTYETLQVIALAALLASCFLPSYRIASQLVAGSSLLVSHLCSLNPQITAITPALDSPWLSSHVTTIMLSYSLFALLLFRPDRRMLLAAELLLATGIILGSIWAKTAWGSYWQWDPKETWALVTFLIYRSDKYFAA